MLYLKLYLLIAVVSSLIFFILGLIFKGKLLGKQVPCGLFNSWQLGLFWPISILAIVGGILFDVIMFFKKL